MQKKASVTATLDARSTMSNGNHPIKLMVYINYKQYRVGTPLSASTDGFKNYKTGTKLSAEGRQLRDDIAVEISKANEILSRMEAFSVDAFKKAYQSDFVAPKLKSANLKLLYDMKIAELESGNQFNSVNSYKCSYSNLNKFGMEELRLKDGNVTLEHLTIDNLNKFKQWNEKKGNSIGTTRSYLRNLRHIFNIGIQENIIHQSLYPFGRKKNSFTIGANVAAKKFLTTSEVHNLFFDKRYENHTARLFWLWSYYCGQNPADILLLRTDDMYCDGINWFIKFNRQKTKNSSQTTRPIRFHLKPDMLNVIQKLRPADSTSKFLFPILNDGMSGHEKHYAILAWRRLINRQLNRIGKNLGFRTELNMSIARCTFATTLYKQGVSIAKVSYLMGHASIKTTELYLGLLTEDELAEVGDTLDSFKKGKSVNYRWPDTKFIDNIMQVLLQ